MKSLFNKYWYISFIVALVLIYVCIYLIFLTHGPFPTGDELNKNDWLSFSGSYIGMAATIFLGIIVYKQNARLNDLNEKLMKITIREKIPIIICLTEDIYKSFNLLDAESQKIIKDKYLSIDPLRPFFSFKKNKQFYLIYQDGKFELRQAFPGDDPDFMKIIEMEDSKDIIKKIILINVTDTTALNVRATINSVAINFNFHLPPKEQKEIVVAIPNYIDIFYRLDFTALTGEQYYQEGSFLVRSKNGSWYGVELGLPKPIES